MDKKLFSVAKQIVQLGIEACPTNKKEKEKYISLFQEQYNIAQNNEQYNIADVFHTAILTIEDSYNCTDHNAQFCDWTIKFYITHEKWKFSDYPEVLRDRVVPGKNCS